MNLNLGLLVLLLLLAIETEMTTSEVSGPAVSVVIPCRNEVRHIRRCIESLVGQQQPPGGMEVIVADGMSDDGTRDELTALIGQYPQLKMVDNPERITPCAMNVGIRASRGRFIAIVGAHSRYAPDYIVQCLEVSQRTRADNVGGAMRCEGKGLVQRAIAAAHHSPFSVGGAAWHNPDYDGLADTVFGGFYRREVFDRIGFFDEILVRNQDDEFNLRLTRSGGTIWHSPSIQSWYSPRGSVSALFRQYLQYGYWKVRVIRKHRLPSSWRHLVPAAFVAGLGMLTILAGGSWIASVFATDAIAYRWCLRVASALSITMLSIVAAYVLSVVVASTLTAARYGRDLLWVLPAVFPCYHLGYGLGFLRGLWDWSACSGLSSKTYSLLNRDH